MKYGIWRHENALGNSAEQAVCLSRFIKETKDESPHVYVETDFQKYFAMCIPGVETNVDFYPNLEKIEQIKGGCGYDNPDLDDIFMPSPPYSFRKKYPATWEHLCTKEQTQPDLIFPFNLYENKHFLPTNSILISIREARTYWHRVDGDYYEPHRYVNPKTFFDIALHYANKGCKVVRIGDKNQTPMPVHQNILDFAKVEDRNMLDDLFLVATCKLHLSTDSGIWPMTGGMQKNLIFSNFCNGKNATVEWLSKKTSIIIPKYKTDNTFKQLVEAVDKFL